MSRIVLSIRVFWRWRRPGRAPPRWRQIDVAVDCELGCSRAGFIPARGINQTTGAGLARASGCVPGKPVSGLANHQSVMREGPLSLPQKYLKLVSELVTPGAIGVALLLGSAASSAASQDPAGQQATRAQDERVSERLAAIREAVSAVSGSKTQTGERAGDRRMA